MASRFRRFIIRPIANFFHLAEFLMKRYTKKLREQRLEEITDGFVELLLRDMDWFFLLTPDRRFRDNLKNFNGRYLFRTASGTVAVSATFSDGNMHVCGRAIDDWDTRVTFKDGKAFREFILTPKPDIFNWLSENKVAVDGNLNHIFKFGFMARAIVDRIERAFG